MWDLGGAFTGVVFAVLMIIGAVIVGEIVAGPTAPSTVIAREFMEKSDDTDLGSMISLVGILFFFPFLAFFRNHLRKAEGEDGWLTSTAYGGGLVTAAVLLVLVALNLATTAISPGVDPVVSTVLRVLDWNYIWVFAPPMIAFILGSSLAIVRYSALPRWLGWVGILVSLTLLMPWIGVAVALIWILLVSLTLTYLAWKRDASTS